MSHGGLKAWPLETRYCTQPSAQSPIISMKAINLLVKVKVLRRVQKTQWWVNWSPKTRMKRPVKPDPSDTTCLLICQTLCSDKAKMSVPLPLSALMCYSWEDLWPHLKALINLLRDSFLPFPTFFAHTKRIKWTVIEGNFLFLGKQPTCLDLCTPLLIYNLYFWKPIWVFPERLLMSVRTEHVASLLMLSITHLIPHLRWLSSKLTTILKNAFSKDKQQSHSWAILRYSDQAVTYIPSLHSDRLNLFT